MDEAVLILFQPLLLVGVVEISGLKLLQLLFLFSLLLFGALLLLLKCHQSICSLAPFGPGISHLNFDLSQCRTTETVQPEPLLPRPRQQLGLTLNREVNQQRPELKQLLTVHRAAIQTTTTGKRSPSCRFHSRLIRSSSSGSNSAAINHCSRAGLS